MRKSKGISKFEAEWQFLRVSVKGQFNNDLEYKLGLVRAYFEKAKTYDRWERVYNWVEGLNRGFKACSDLQRIERTKVELEFYNSYKPNEGTRYFSPITIESYTAQERLAVWKDLLSVNKKWLISGYRHEESLKFVFEVFKVMVALGEASAKINQQAGELRQLIEKSKLIKNKHKFFF